LGTGGWFSSDARCSPSRGLRARSRSLEAARELLEKGDWLTDPSFHVALQAVLEVLPVSAAFSKIELTPALSGFGSDFEALENLRRLAFAEHVDEPEQLKLWKEAEVAEA
jgi:putative DNA methylase